MFVLLILLKSQIMKYLKISNYLILISLIVSLISCENCIEPTGTLKNRTLKVESFSKLNVDIPANVKLTMGDSVLINISAPESVIKNISTSVRRGKLNIEGNICGSKNNKINIEITTPNISAINISGSADVFSQTPFKTDKLVLNVSGSGSIQLNTFSNSITAEISGSGDIMLSGTAQKLGVEISGSGSFKGLGLNTYTASISISGSGDASTTVLNNLNAKVTGSGHINYSGEPKLNAKVTGSGNVTKIN